MIYLKISSLYITRVLSTIYSVRIRVLTLNFPFQYGDIEFSGESDNEEPNQQTVEKYLCSRRHTVGPGDTHHEEVRTDPGFACCKAGGDQLAAVKCITFITFHQPVFLLKEAIARLF